MKRSGSGTVSIQTPLKLVTILGWDIAEAVIAGPDRYLG